MTRRRDASTTELAGSMVALVTPFSEGKVDFDALGRLVDFQVESGTDALVPCGTTGESPTLTQAEHEQVIGFIIERAASRCLVIAGTGTNSTVATVERTRRAAESGADAALVVAPYYNRSTQEGLFRHYAAVADAVDLPLVVYNVPKRTGVHIAEDTIIRLRREFPNIAAVKHATGSVDGIDRILAGCDVKILSGDDALTWPMMALGAAGTISVIANLAPKLVKDAVDAAARGEMQAALAGHRRVAALMNELNALGPNPIPIKTALALAGRCEAEFRLPLCELEEEARDRLAAVLRSRELV